MRLRPFSFEFHCTYDHAYENGCWAKATVDLNEILNGSQYRRGCLLPAGAFVPADVTSVEADLSGVQVWLTPQSAHMPYKELLFDTMTVELTGNEVTWYVHVNWRDQAGTMIDGFNVRVGGELVWSTGEVSDVRRRTFSCVDESESCTSSTTFRTPFDYVGSAFSKIYLSVPKGTTIGELASSITESLTSPSNVTLGVSCSIGNSHLTECAHDVVVLSGESTEVTPFTSANFSATSNQPVFFSTGQSQPNLSPHREMRCGLKHFSAAVVSPNRFGSLRVGAGPADCGFNGVLRPSPPNYVPLPPGIWSYSVTSGFHGFLIEDSTLPGTSQTFTSEFRLDGAKLVWP